MGWGKEHWPDWDIYVAGKCKCEYCGFEGTTLEGWRNLDIDHLIPRKRGGGSDNRINKVVSCQACNRAKGSYNPARGTGLVEPRDFEHRKELIGRAGKEIFSERKDEEAAFREMMEAIQGQLRHHE
jgi:5-methylcytosine-specific restriction endonuclease McrA